MIWSDSEWAEEGKNEQKLGLFFLILIELKSKFKTWKLILLKIHFDRVPFSHLS